MKAQLVPPPARGPQAELTSRRLLEVAALTQQVAQLTTELAEARQGKAK